MSDPEDYAPDEEQIVDVPSVDYTVFYSNETWFGQDEHGQFQLRAGSSTDPKEKRDEYNYEPCGAVLRHSYERYGERKYCEAMAVENFGNNAPDNYKYPERCRRHQNYGELMDQQERNAKHLAFVESYSNIFDYLSAHEQIFAVETFKSLLSESKYDFETDENELTVDGTESDLFETDELTIEFPVPSEQVARAKALWFASLDYVRMENILEEQFRTAAEEEGPDGEPLTVGERTTVVSVTDEGRVIEDKDEHHLNLPLSRIQKDYERHLEVGGVEHDGGEETSDEEARTWILKKEGADSDSGSDDDVGFEPDPDAT